MSLDTYLADLPLLHTWDLGKTWNTGGFSAAQLRRMYEVIDDRFPQRSVRVLETGAGNSTITFLHLTLRRLVSIAPDEDLRDRIVEYCKSHDVELAPLDFRLQRSEVELPTLAFGTDDQHKREQFDVTLIDGGHGWPTVFVDFCYANYMIRAGALLFLDDLQLYSVAELSRLLERQPGFTLEEQVAKLQIWRKDDNRPFLPEHSRQPYILEMTNQQRERRR